MEATNVAIRPNSHMHNRFILHLEVYTNRLSWLIHSHFDLRVLSQSTIVTMCISFPVRDRASDPFWWMRPPRPRTRHRRRTRHRPSTPVRLMTLRDILRLPLEAASAYDWRCSEAMVPHRYKAMCMYLLTLFLTNMKSRAALIITCGNAG